MIALLRKDARLSLDALRPWALCCAAALVVVGAIAVLPADLRERFFGRSPAEGVAGAFGGSLMSSALRFVADAIAWTTIPVSLFLGAAIGLGDRLHGARLLAAVLPHRRRDRVISIMTVGLVASLVPPLVMFAVAWLSGRPTIGTEVPALLPMASVSAVGIGLGLGLMLTGRQANGLGGWTVHRWHCVVLGALVLGIGLIIGGVAGRMGIPIVDRPLADGITSVEQSAALQSFLFGFGDRVRGIAFLGGGLAGALAMGLTGWLAALVLASGLGSSCRGCPTLSRSMAGMIVGVGILICVIAGGLAGGVAAGRSAVAWRLPSYADARLPTLDRTMLARMLERSLERQLAGAGGAMLRGDLFEFLSYPDEAIRLALTDLGERDPKSDPTDPLRMKLYELQSLETEQHAWWTLANTPGFDPSHLRLTLLATEKWPSEWIGHTYLLTKLRPGYLQGDLQMDPRETRLAYHDRVIRWVLPLLEALATEPPGALPPEVEAQLAAIPGRPWILPPVDAATRAEIVRLLPVFRERAERARQAAEASKVDVPTDESTGDTP